MDGKKICKFCGLEFGNKVLKEHYSVVHQGEEQINKSIQEFLPEKNMNFETMMKTPNEKKDIERIGIRIVNDRKNYFVNNKMQV